MHRQGLEGIKRMGRSIIEQAPKRSALILDGDVFLNLWV